jgi:hypothetical protein
MLVLVLVVVLVLGSIDAMSRAECVSASGNVRNGRERSEQISRTTTRTIPDSAH